MPFADKEQYTSFIQSIAKWTSARNIYTYIRILYVYSMFKLRWAQRGGTGGQGTVSYLAAQSRSGNIMYLRFLELRCITFSDGSRSALRSRPRYTTVQTSPSRETTWEWDGHFLCFFLLLFSLLLVGCRVVLSGLLLYSPFVTVWCVFIYLCKVWMLANLERRNVDEGSLHWRSFFVVAVVGWSREFIFSRKGFFTHSFFCDSLRIMVTGKSDVCRHLF